MKSPGLHESFNTVTDATWAIPGGILALLVGLTFFPFLWSLPKATRNAFFLAGCIYIGGAGGVEIIGAPMDADTMTYNLTGWPSVVIPCGLDESGLPIGIQIIAAPFREDQCLAVAEFIQSELDFFPFPNVNALSAVTTAVKNNR